MNRPITFRTLLLTNGMLAVALIAILLVSTTLAGPGVSSTPAEPVQHAPAAPDTTLASMPRQATADSPLLPFQGMLTDSNGTPITDTVTMSLALYPEPSGGTAVWQEERSGDNAVTVTNGLFTVMLGSVEPISTTLLTQPLWLGISVNGDAEMEPRQLLNSGPAGAMLTPHSKTISMQFVSDALHPSCQGDNAEDVSSRRHLHHMVNFDSPGTGEKCWGRAIVRLPDDWHPGTDLRIAALASSAKAQSATPRFYYGTLNTGSESWDKKSQTGPTVQVEPAFGDVTLLTIPAADVEPGDTVVVAFKFTDFTEPIEVTGVYMEYTASGW